MASYFGVGQYAPNLTRDEWEEALLPDNRACSSSIFNPVIEPDSFAPNPEIDSEEIDPNAVENSIEPTPIQEPDINGTPPVEENLLPVP
jgi:hypothetical protein